MPVHQIFFYSLLALLPTQLGYHTWPSWAMVLGRRVDYLSPTLYLTDLSVLLILIFWLIESISQVKNHELGMKKLQQQVHVFIIHYSKFIIPFLLFAVLNIFYATNRMVAVYAWVKVLEYALLGWYIIRTKPKFLLIVGALSVGIFYSSIIAILQFIFQRSLGGPLWFLGERTFNSQTPGIAQIPWCFPAKANCPLFLRAYGTLPHPNVLGGFLAVTLPLLFTLRINDNMMKILKWIGLVVGTVALILTFSRSSWIVGMIGILLYIGKKRNIKLFTPLLLLAIFLFIFLGSTFHIYDESVIVRQQLNAASVKIFLQAPLTGIGLGNFLVALPHYLPSRQIYFLQPVHNIYLLLLSEIGIIGIAGVGIIVFCLLNHKSSIKNKDSKFIIRYSLFSVLFLGLVDHYFLTLQQGQLLFTLLLALNVVL